MSAWFERQKEKDKNFRAQQLDAFEKHRGQLQLEVLEKRSEYREFPTEKNRKYIETREREIEENQATAARKQQPAKRQTQAQARWSIEQKAERMFDW